MIEYRQGNLLEANAEALVNSVNCVGVMGKGIALQFKQAYPVNYQAYAKACQAGGVEVGRVFIVPTGQVMNPKYIVNFPTKRHWRGNSKLEYVESGLQSLVKEVKRLGIRSIAIPPLGCGFGGLEWTQVRPMIVRAFEEIPEVQVFLYEPEGAPKPAQMPVATERPRMTPGRSVFIKLMELYRSLGYELSLLEVQKLAYFLQSAGLDLKLHYQKQQFGPYAEEVHYVLQRMEGHYIRGYGDRSQRAQIIPLPGAIEAANEFLKGNPETGVFLDRVQRLIEGFETPYGMELLATVHWVASENPVAAQNPEEAIQSVRKWNERKKERYKPEHIRVAWERLRSQDWIHA